MEWTRGQAIGRGSTATVWIAKDDRSGEVFAVKSTQLSKSEFLQREQRILSTLACPQIIAYKGSNISAENGDILYNLFMEYAPGGSLTDAIRNNGGSLEEFRIRSYTRALLHGLHYLHSNGIVHRDIKSQNILVTNEGAKIGDLGCATARRVNEHDPLSVSGTPIYMAPEVARGEEQNFPADVWAAGCTVLEMATGQAPWADVSDPAFALYRIGFSSEVPQIPSYMSKQAQDFLSKCLVRNPAARWTASELLEHDFVRGQNFVSTGTETYNVDTPTSVLNQGIWDSYSVERTEKSSHKICSNSAQERIRQLCEGNSDMHMVNWEWDEIWVTVRSNIGSKEPSEGFEGSNLSSSAAKEVSIIGGGCGTDRNRVLANVEYDLDIPDVFITTKTTSYSEADRCNTCSYVGTSYYLLTACKSKNIAKLIFRNLIVRNKKKLHSNFINMITALLFYCLP